MVLLRRCGPEGSAGPVDGVAPICQILPSCSRPVPCWPCSRARSGQRPATSSSPHTGRATATGCRRTCRPTPAERTCHAGRAEVWRRNVRHAHKHERSNCCRRCSSTRNRSAVDLAGCRAHPSSEGFTATGAVPRVVANHHASSPCALTSSTPLRSSPKDRSRALVARPDPASGCSRSRS